MDFPLNPGEIARFAETTEKMGCGIAESSAFSVPIGVTVLEVAQFLMLEEGGTGETIMLSYLPIRNTRFHAFLVKRLILDVEDLPSFAVN